MDQALTYTELKRLQELGNKDYIIHEHVIELSDNQTESERQRGVTYVC